MIIRGPAIIHSPIQQIARGGWAHIDPFRATRYVIAPLTVGLLGMLLFPAGALYGLRKLFNLQLADDFLCKSRTMTVAMTSL